MLGLPPSLLELGARVQAISTTLLEGIDPDDREARAALEGMYEDVAARTQDELAAFADWTARLVDAAEADAKALKALVSQYQQRIGRLERAQEDAREHLHQALALFGERKVRTLTATWSISTRYKADVRDEAAVQAAGFTRTKIETDRAALAEALKAGATVPGASWEPYEVLTKR